MASTDSLEHEASPRRRNPLAASLAWLWNHYSPNGEFPLSTLASTAFHISILVLVSLLAYKVATPETLPPAVSTVRVSDSPEAAAGKGDDLTPGDELETGNPSELMPKEDVPQTLEAEKVADVQEFKPIEKGITQKEQQDKAIEKVDKARTAASTASAAVADAKRRLNDNMTKAGGGGAGAKGRAARPARWSIEFPNSTVEDQLAQYEALGFTLAVPLQGDRWRFFPKPSSERGRSEVRDLSSESQMYWISENPQAVRVITDALGVPSAQFFVMFLPRAQEEKLLALELAYFNLEEDEIASTKFECVPKDGGYDLVVVNQIAK